MAAIVLVPGFMTPKNHKDLSKKYFGAALDVVVPGIPNVLSVRPSPCASLHDRAVEIFYELKGGTTDYGEKHSKRHGHKRFGHVYSKPLFKEWSSKRPAHFVGHSLGGQTARMLHFLLESGFFAEYGADASWIKSITTISSPLNGAMSVYALGAKSKQKEGERSSVVPFSPGFCLGIFIHLYDYMYPSILKKYTFDFGMDHYTQDTSLKDLLHSIFVKSQMFEGEDSANFDMAPHIAREHNRVWKTLPCTYYFSFVGKLTKNEKERSQSVSHLIGFLFLTFLTWFVEILKWKHVCSSMPKGEAEERWNSGTDGLVTCISQAYPHIGPSGSVPKHRKIKSLANLPSSPNPGCWYVIDVDTHHLGIVPFPSSYEKQRSFFIELFNKLASLPP